MDLLAGFFQGIPAKRDSDWADRLSYQISPSAFIIVSTCLNWWSLVGKPINCWYAATYTDFWAEYGDDICYATNTYYVPMFEKTLNMSSAPSSMVPIPRDKSIKDELALNYYQWTGFFLLFQAACFYLPVKIWSALSSHGNMNIDTILDVVKWRVSRKDDKKDDDDVQTKKVALFVFHKHAVGRSAGKYNFFCYLLIKCLFAANAFLQFVALKHFLGEKNYMWGWKNTKALWEGYDPETPAFPRNTLCDFDIYVLGDIHNHTTPCVLTINIVNEKIFLVIWWWLLFIFAASLTTFLQWIFYFLIPGHRVATISRFVAVIDPKANDTDIKDFVKELRVDGAFLIEVIIAKEGELPAADLLKAMWEKYQQEKGRCDNEKNSAKEGVTCEDGDSFIV